MIPFSDGAGEIVEIGGGGSHWKTSDRVAGIVLQKWLGGKITEAAARSALGGAIDGVVAEFMVFHEDGLADLTGYPASARDYPVLWGLEIS